MGLMKHQAAILSTLMRTLLDSVDLSYVKAGAIEIYEDPADLLRDTDGTPVLRRG